MNTTNTPSATLAGIDLDKLEAMARAATPGPWTWWTSNSNLRLTGADGRDGGVLYGYVHSGDGDVNCAPKDQAFIAAANPATVLALIAQARAAAPVVPAGASVRDMLRWSQADTDYHGKIAFTPSQFDHFVSMLRATPAAAAAPEGDAKDAPELDPKDIAVLNRWGNQIERLASVFSDERALLCRQVSILMSRITCQSAAMSSSQKEGDK